MSGQSAAGDGDPVVAPTRLMTSLSREAVAYLALARTARQIAPHAVRRMGRLCDRGLMSS